jgi:hypothetical protein
MASGVLHQDLRPFAVEARQSAQNVFQRLAGSLKTSASSESHIGGLLKAHSRRQRFDLNSNQIMPLI